MYTYTHIHIYTYTHIHIYTYKHTHIHIYTYAHIHIHIHIYTYLHIHIYTYTDTHIQIYTYTHIHTHIHSYTNTLKHLYTYRHIQLHTQCCSVRPVNKLNRISYFELVPMFCLNLLLSPVMFRLAPDSDLSKVFVRALRELNEQDGSTVRTVENFVLSAYQVSYTQVFIN